MGQQRKRRSFTDEFKRDAVALVLETDRPIAHVARELGIGESSLGNWVQKARKAERDPEPLGEAQSRIEQLEAELAEAKRERDLLKRTVAFWVKESTP